jgi:hypothetical protein
MEWLAMEPEAIPISEEAIAQYQKRPFASARPEDEAWVEVGGECCAVGYLARERFCANPALRVLKSERAQYKVLAMVGAIAARKRLPSRFSLQLGVLLPYGEYEDRESLRQRLAADLSDFKFRGKGYRVQLTQFDCLPEGGGLLLRGLERGQDGAQGLVVMVGYRNASYLLMERGAFRRGETRDLGFVQMLERVVEATSGLSPLAMAGAVCQAGKRVNRGPLKNLCRRLEDKPSGTRVAKLVESVKSSRREYWEMLSDWLVTCRFPSRGQVILSGGTAYYYQEELEKFFSRQGAKVTWAEHLEARVKRLLGEQEEFKYRLTDVCGYFYWLQYKFAGHQASPPQISV